MLPSNLAVGQETAWKLALVWNFGDGVVGSSVAIVTPDAMYHGLWFIAILLCFIQLTSTCFGGTSCFCGDEFWFHRETFEDSH